MHPALNVLFSLRPAKDVSDVDENLRRDVLSVCPAAQHLSEQPARPYTEAALTTLAQIYGMLLDSEWEYILGAIDAGILERVGNLILEGSASFLQDIPQLKELMRSKTAWTAGVALILASAYLVIRSLENKEGDVPDAGLRKNVAQESTLPVEPAAPPVASATPRRQIMPSALTELKEFFRAVKNAELDPSNIVISPVELENDVILELAGSLEAPVAFATLARLNAAFKAAWPQAQDLTFDVQAGDNIITYRYRIA